jgi:hypothetical protein
LSIVVTFPLDAFWAGNSDRTVSSASGSRKSSITM